MDFNGNDISKSLYDMPKKKKKRIKKIEKVEQPDHWDKDFDANELKLEQQTSDDDE